MGSIRESMSELISVLGEVGEDVARAEAEIVTIMKGLLALPGLESLPASPTGVSTPVDANRPSTGWLYYDGHYRLVRGHMPAGFVQQPHNHGSWNILAVYRGAMFYRSYRRLDDGSRPYVAELEVTEDRVMTEGDVTVLPGPPHDIHMNAGLAPGTVTLLVAGEQFLPLRHQYLPELGVYYEVDAERAAR